MFGMRQEIMRRGALTALPFCLLLVMSNGWAVAACAQGKKGNSIVHDAEYYILFPKGKPAKGSEAPNNS